MKHVDIHTPLVSQELQRSLLIGFLKIETVLHLDDYSPFERPLYEFNNY